MPPWDHASTSHTVCWDWRRQPQMRAFVAMRLQTIGLQSRLRRREKVWCMAVPSHSNSKSNAWSPQTRQSCWTLPLSPKTSAPCRLETFPDGTTIQIMCRPRWTCYRWLAASLIARSRWTMFSSPVKTSRTIWSTAPYPNNSSQTIRNSCRSSSCIRRENQVATTPLLRTRKAERQCSNHIKR